MCVSCKEEIWKTNKKSCYSVWPVGASRVGPGWSNQTWSWWVFLIVPERLLSQTLERSDELHSMANLCVYERKSESVFFFFFRKKSKLVIHQSRPLFSVWLYQYDMLVTFLFLQHWSRFMDENGDDEFLFYDKGIFFLFVYNVGECLPKKKKKSKEMPFWYCFHVVKIYVWGCEDEVCQSWFLTVFTLVQLKMFPLSCERNEAPAYGDSSPFCPLLLLWRAI